MINKFMKFNRQGYGKHEPVPWWNKEIEEQRKEINRTRRKLTRFKAKGNQEEIELVRGEYKKCKKDLNYRIRKAKKES